MGRHPSTIGLNESEIEQFSPEYDTPAKTSLPLSNPSMGIAAASPRTSERPNVSGVQLCPGGNQHVSDNSRDWQISPVTPVMRLDGIEPHLRLVSDGGLYDILEDETPEILKETPAINPVKVSSPNKKRVSPPHRHLHESGTTSSGPLRSGRKFILRSVPSFPPLTPCVDFKSSNGQNSSDVPVPKKAGNK